MREATTLPLLWRGEPNWETAAGGRDASGAVLEDENLLMGIEPVAYVPRPAGAAPNVMVDPGDLQARPARGRRRRGARPHPRSTGGRACKAFTADLPGSKHASRSRSPSAPASTRSSLPPATSRSSSATRRRRSGPPAAMAAWLAPRARRARRRRRAAALPPGAGGHGPPWPSSNWTRASTSRARGESGISRRLTPAGTTTCRSSCTSCCRGGRRGRPPAASAEPSYSRLGLLASSPHGGSAGGQMAVHGTDRGCTSPSRPCTSPTHAWPSPTSR